MNSFVVEYILPLGHRPLAQLGAVHRHWRKIMEPFIGMATVDHQVVGAIQPPAMLVGAGAAIRRDPRVELPNTAALNNLHADLRSAARRDRPQYFSRTVRLDV